MKKGTTVEKIGGKRKRKPIALKGDRGGGDSIRWKKNRRKSRAIQGKSIKKGGGDRSGTGRNFRGGENFKQKKRPV